ncbi:MAG: tetratricopeptide repeat protein [Akkermansiaceae bacterium]
MKTLLTFIFLSILTVASAQEALRPAEQAMQVKQFAKAVELLDRYLTDGENEAKDYATYLKSLALFYDKKSKAAAETCDLVIDKYENSKWRRKALFLKSRILIEQKKFEEAEAIYEAEAMRLFSSKRKKGLANILIEFGDEMAREPDEKELDAPPADFTKAIQLYQKALTIEIDRELRDTVQFKIARAHQKLNQWAVAEQHYQKYLKEFDPKWSGTVGSPERFRGQLRENPLPAGDHWKDARFHLVEVQLALAGQVIQIVPGQRYQKLQVQNNASGFLPKLQMARQNAEDLLKLTENEDEAFKADTRWMLVRSYNLPHPAVSELGQAIRVAENFLENHASHPRAMDTARLIAVAHRNAGQTDDAIAAFQAFASEKSFSFVPEETEADPNIRTGASCNETFQMWTSQAVHLVGQLRFEQKNYEEAIRQWREYIARFPNGAEWSACQSGIINAQFQVGLDAVEAKEYAAARKHFDQFLKDHPLDGRARQILFTMGQIDFSLAMELEDKHENPDQETTRRIEGHFRKATEEWERLVSKYPRTEEASLALYRIGMVQEEKLGELDQALATYQRLNWGKYAGKAKQRFQTMTNHSLNVRTERTFRTNEDAFIEVTSRNASKLKFDLYRLNLEAYFRKMHGIGGVEDLDIDLIQPDKTWELEVDGFSKYKPITQRIKIPFDASKAGVCVVKVSEEDFEATTLVVRSDIEIITKTSRRELLVYAQNMVTMKPAPGVSIIASNGKEVFGTGRTGKDGVFRKEYFETLKDASGVGVFAKGEGGIASCGMNLSGLKFSSGLTTRGYIYTEKPVYRPSEMVHIRGMIREVKDGSYEVPKARSYFVRILDPKGRMLKESKVKLSDFGAFDHSMAIDEYAPLGAYTIQVSSRNGVSSEVYNGKFEVQRYKLEKVKLVFEFPSDVIFRGETIKAKLKANYYWGSPAVGETVDYTLPDGRTYSQKTDKDGAIEIDYDPSGFLPGRFLGFSAIVKQHNVSTSDQVFLAKLGFKAEVMVDQAIALAGAPFETTIKTTGADGKPVGKEVTLYVLRREKPKVDAILSAVPWIQRQTQAAGEVTVEEHRVTTDSATGLGTVKLSLTEGGLYVLRASGEDRFGQVVTAQNSLTVSDDTDASKLRFFANDSTGKVGADLPVRLHSRIDDALALMTIEGEEILSYRILELKKGFNEIDLSLGHEHFPNFRISVAAIDGRELRETSKDFIVKRELKVNVVPSKEIEFPGAETMVRLVVTDQNDKPVEAALSLALVNEALYSLYPETLPPILDFFQLGAQRNAEFVVQSTCDFYYAARTQAVVKSITEEKERLARRQKEMAQLAKLRSEGGYGLGRDMFQRGGSGGGGGGMSDFDDQTLQPSGATASAEAAMRFRQAAGERGANSPDQSKAIDSREAKKDGETQSEQLAKPRKEVMSASRWISPVITDAQGIAKVRIPLPESTTQWRLTARGCSKEALVGEGVSSLIARKDFFLELKTPVMVQEGDQMRFLAKVHNLTDFEGNADLVLSVNGNQEKLSRKTVEIKAHSVTECLFASYDIALAESVEIRAAANSGELTDELAIELPVRAWGMEFAGSAGGVSSGDADAVVSLPDGMEFTKQALEVSLSPSVEKALMDYALRRRQGSAADALLASVSALNYAKEHGAREEDIRKLSERAQSLVASLTSVQEDDGQWSWKGQKDLYLTCRTYWALGLAGKSGIPVQSDLLSKTETLLNQTFSRLGANDNDNKSMILHALSVRQKADFAHLNRIYRERAKLSNNALARTAVAMINLDRDDFARDLVELLEKNVKLEAPVGQPKIAWWEGSGYTVLRDRNETTAMVLLAIAGVKPDSPLAKNAANLLLKNYGCLSYRSPQALGSAVAALAEFYAGNEAKETDFEIRVIVNDKQIAKVKSGEIGGRLSIPVPTKFIKSGNNIVRFEKAGPGQYSFSVLLTGFSRDMKSRNDWGSRLRLTGDSYYHGNLNYRGIPLKAASSSPVSKVEVGQKIRVVSGVYDPYSDARREYRVRKQYLPAGMLLVDGSVSGNFQRYEVGDGVITCYYRAGQSMGSIAYELVGYAPGTYRVLPGTIRDFYNRERVVVGKVHTITVLAPTEKSDDPYRMNHSEHFELANLNFNDGNYEVALTHLTHLFDHERNRYERDLARMLLWIYTMEDYFDAQRVVEMFEILRERHPSLTIPFDKILVVGKAYRLIGEFERAWLVFRATIDSSFINDASLSATLEDQGQFLGSIEYMDSIWLEYPNTSAVVSTHFALSQQLFDKAPKAHELKAEEERRNRVRGTKASERKDFDRIGLLKGSLEYLHRFLTHHPLDPLADDAAFSMANAYFALEDYQTVVDAAEGFRKVYPKSSFATSFQYMAALGHFWQYHYDKALAAAAPVTKSESKDRDYARYITAQIHHALGAPGDAIEWYEKVKSLYPDAVDAIDYFKEKKIEMDEVTTFEPKEKVEIELRFRNVKEAYLQIYRVDLMKLYLREKNLSNITKVHLAGIEPEMEMTLDLGDGEDYRDRDRTATLPLKEEGAYLVICRGDDLFTSGMVLVTPLKLEIQENPGGGSVRVNVRDTVDKGYQAKVHVKAIGSQDVEFKSGDTDLRGIFVAEGVNGTATVIARQDGRYAFYRGENHLGQAQPNQPVRPAAQKQQQQLEQGDYLNNLNDLNYEMQRGNIGTWNELRRSKGGKGVEIQQAK